MLGGAPSSLHGCPFNRKRSGAIARLFSRVNEKMLEHLPCRLKRSGVAPRSFHEFHFAGMHCKMTP
jgi:hypothetical protein